MARQGKSVHALVDELMVQTRVCQFCREYGRTWHEYREVFKYGVRHYAHPWCLAGVKGGKGGVGGALALIAEHERTDFLAKLEARRKKVAALVRERFEEWTKANGGEPAALCEEELVDQLKDRLPGLDEQEVYAALRDLGAVPSEVSGPEYDNELTTVYRLPAGLSAPFDLEKVTGLTPIRIYPKGRRRHDLANAIVAVVSKGRPVVVVGTAEQERNLRKRTKKILDAHPEYAKVMYERPVKGDVK